MEYFLAVLCGCSLAVGGLSYKFGSQGRVYPIQLSVFLSLAGMLYFGLKGWQEWAGINWQILALGAVGGAGQYGGIRLFRKALTCGPLSPAWCACALGGFVPVIIFSACFLGEKINACSILSIAAAVAAVIAAAWSNEDGTRKNRGIGRMLYSFLLGWIVLLISLFYIVLKFSRYYTPAGQKLPLLLSSGSILMFFVYVFMGGCSALDLTVSRT